MPITRRRRHRGRLIDYAVENDISSSPSPPPSRTLRLRSRILLLLNILLYNNNNNIHSVALSPSLLRILTDLTRLPPTPPAQK